MTKNHDHNNMRFYHHNRRRHHHLPKSSTTSMHFIPYYYYYYYLAILIIVIHHSRGISSLLSSSSFALRNGRALRTTLTFPRSTARQTNPFPPPAAAAAASSLRNKNQNPSFSSSSSSPPLLLVLYNNKWDATTNTEAEDSSLVTTTNNSNKGLGLPMCVYQTLTIPPSSSLALTTTTTTTTGTLGNKNNALLDDNDDSTMIPRQDIHIVDLTPQITSFLSTCQMQNGVLHIISQHTTTAITINERESRLAQDIANYFLHICPPDERSIIGGGGKAKAKASSLSGMGARYLHNDIHLRPESDEEAQRCRDNGWDIDNPIELQRWRDQEPINAHSHLISMMLGSSECIPVVNGQLMIGQWQSILMVDLDGPRVRSVGIQAMGYK